MNEKKFPEVCFVDEWEKNVHLETGWRFWKVKSVRFCFFVRNLSCTVILRSSQKKPKFQHSNSLSKSPCLTTITKHKPFVKDNDITTIKNLPKHLTLSIYVVSK
ncbi:hypothetical protein ACKWTF_012601 [Chironomus riparius]